MRRRRARLGGRDGLLYSPGDVNRLYYGTDTRAQSLLVGAALAVALSLWADRRHRAGAVPAVTARIQRGSAAIRPGPCGQRGGRAAVLAVGLAGVAVSAVLWTLVSYNEALAYRGGFLLAALATAGRALQCRLLTALRPGAAASRSPRCAMSVGSPMACTSGISRSSSTSTTPGPG